MKAERLRAVVLCSLAAVLAAPAGSAAAEEPTCETRSWIGGAGDWFDAAHWCLPGSPQPSDELIVLCGSPHATSTVSASCGGSIRFDGSAAQGAFGWLDIGECGTGSLEVLNGADITSECSALGVSDGSRGAATVRGPGSTWDYGGCYLWVGEHGSGTLDILDGGRVSGSVGAIACRAGSAGQVTVAGGGSTWAMSDNLFVGYFGVGVLDILCGGKVALEDHATIGHGTGGFGRLTVEGSGSAFTAGRDLWVGGVDGSGSLDITGGGSVRNGDSQVGFNAGTVGHVGLSGPGSSWTQWALNVGGGCHWTGDSSWGRWLYGGAGTGTVEVSNRARLSPLWTYVGYSPGSTGRLTVDNSTWTNQEGIYVGVEGDGTVEITGGSEVTGRGGYIGWFAGSAGRVVVDGPGSVWNQACVYLGLEGGDGTVEIRNGGRIVGISNCVNEIGDGPGGRGRVVVDGGQWDAGVIHVGGYGRGLLEIRGGGRINSNRAAIGYERRSYGDVIVDGPGSAWAIGGDLLLSGAYWDDEAGYDLPPGVATMRIANGAAVSTAGIAVIATGLGSAAAVAVTGPGSTWTIGGNLYLGWGSGYPPDPDDYPDPNVPPPQWPQPSPGPAVGTLEIADGAVVRNGAGRIGFGPDGVGSVRVDAAQWICRGSILVADQGTGTLEITGGGTVRSAASYIGYGGFGGLGVGRAVVRGAGSSWHTVYDDLAGDLTIGYCGVGTLDILDGGEVRTWSARIGYGFDLSARGNVTVRGPGSRFASVYDMCVGGSSLGTLTVSEGGAVTDANGYIGYGPPGVGEEAAGHATIAGCGSLWANSGDLYVGYKGTGTLDVLDGGRVTCRMLYIGEGRGSSGTVAIRGPGSELTCGPPYPNVYVGLGGSGTLEVLDGGRMSCDRAYMACWVGSTGLARVVGEGSTWQVEGIALWLATRGRGTLEIADGGQVIDRDCRIACEYADGVGMATVGGSGATWTNTGSVYVAGDGYEEGGRGQIEVLPGGTMSVGQYLMICTRGVVNLDGGTIRFGRCDSLQLRGGQFNFRSGTIEYDCDQTIGSGTPLGPAVRLETPQHISVTGQTAIADTGRLELAGGRFSSGRLTNEGLITGWGTLMTAGGFINGGEVELRGGPSDVAGDLLNEARARISVTDHADVAFWDDVHNEGRFWVGRRCSVTFHGNFTGDAVKGPGDVRFLADVAPGFSPSEVAFDGNVAFAPSARLEIELAGAALGEFDRLIVGQNATLAGTLDLSLLGGFEPSYGQAMEILRAVELAGRFDRVDGLAVGPGMALAVLYAGDSVTVVPALSGDADADGAVSFLDYLTVRAGFGAAAGACWSEGDFDGDGDVDFLDYLAAKDGFGMTCGGDAAAGVDAPGVPEPGGVLLLALGSVAALRRRRAA